MKVDIVREILQHLEPKWMELSPEEQERRINEALAKTEACARHESDGVH
jgi:hypothetical protein